MSNRAKTFKKSKSKSVTFNEDANTVRELSDETKEINRELSKSLKSLIFNTQNNIANGDETIVYGINEIPKSSKTRKKEHIINTLEQVKNRSNSGTISNSKSKSKSTCTICGGKRYKTRKRRRTK